MICRSIDTLPNLLADYLRTHDIKPVSAQQLAITVSLFVRWYERVFSLPFVLQCLTESLVCDFLFDLRDHRASAPKTLNRKRGDLVTLWHHAASKQLLEPPKVKEIIRFREPERIPRAWTQEQLAAHLDACDRFEPRRAVAGWDARHDRAIRLVMYDTAYRFNACLELTRSNLRDDGAIVAIAETQKTLCDEDQWLGPDSMATIRNLPTNLDPRDDRLFPWPLKKRAFWDRWKLILTLAELPATRRDGPQKMRRTSVSWLAVVAPARVRHHLRHKTPGLAEKYYIDPTIARPDKAWELMPRIVQPQKKLF